MGKSDIEIAREAKLQPVQAIAESLGLGSGDLELYGSYKAKVRLETIERLRAQPDGALVLVTAMTPTPAGEGKSTTTVGLGDAFRRLGKRSIVAIREPSLAPSSITTCSRGIAWVWIRAESHGSASWT